MAIKCDCEQCELRTAFFESFSQDELGVFCSMKADTAYSRGDIIFHEGDEVKNFSYLKSGLVKLYKTDPRERTRSLPLPALRFCESAGSIFRIASYIFGRRTGGFRSLPYNIDI
jgi:hypothetical protein